MTKLVSMNSTSSTSTNQSEYEYSNDEGEEENKRTSVQQDEINQPGSVIIVGAGICGLVAAWSLLSKGFKVTLIEAEARVGGRIHSLHHGDNIAELGAQWIHGQAGNPVYEFARQHDLLDGEEETVSDDEKTGLYCTNTGHVIDSDLVTLTLEKLDEIKDLCTHNVDEANYSSVEEIFRDEFNRFKQSLLKLNEQGELTHQSRDLSTAIIDMQSKTNLSQSTKGRSFTLEDIKIMDALLEWYFIFEKIDNACDTLSSLSIKGYSDYIDCAGHSLLTLPRGYSTIVDQLMSQLPLEIVHLSHRVSRIAYGEDLNKVTVTCTLDTEKQHLKTFQADHCIVTVSLGVLKSQSIEFIPPLASDKMKLINALGYGTINKIFVQFEQPFWPVNSGYAVKLVWLDRTAEHENYPAWVFDMTGFDECKSYPATLIGWIGGSGARAIETESTQIILDTCNRLLNQFVRHTSTISKAVKVFHSKWYTNDNFCGSYSHPTKLSDSLCISNSTLSDAIEIYQSNVKQMIPRLIISGEATDPEYFSTTHGAFRSGQRASEQLIRFACRTNELKPKN